MQSLAIRFWQLPVAVSRNFRIEVVPSRELRRRLNLGAEFAQHVPGFAGSLGMSGVDT